MMGGMRGLVVALMAATAVMATSLTRHTRQLIDPGFTDERFLCLLQASASETDGSECNDKQGCICVPFWQCKDNIQQPGREAGLLAVVNVRIDGLACDVVEHKCCSNVDSTLPPPDPPKGNLHQPRCGVRHPDGYLANFQGFIDHQSQFGEFPWMAAVMTSQIHEETRANFYICGASLIHPQAVLTAAHYVYEKRADQLMVRLGEWNFKEPTEAVKHQDFRVTKIEIHPQYSPINFHYDVAILFLDQPAKLGPTVDTICLPEPFQNFTEPNCFSSGWGKNVFEANGAYQQIMKSLELPAVSNDRCQAALRTTRLTSSFVLHPSFMCAGGRAGVDTCTGDGGSPLVCPMASDPTRYVQAGVVAWGIGCGEEGIPGVYAAVSHAVPWINDQLNTLEGPVFDVRLNEQ